MTSRRSLRLSRGAVRTFLALVLLSSAVPARGQKPVPPATAPDPLVRMNESIDALTRKVWPSVVQILVTSYGAREDSGDRGSANVVVGRQRSTGSGFVI